MRDATFLRLSLVAPIVAPAVAIGVAAATDGVVGLLPAVILGGSLLYAGPAYVVFAVGALLWGRGPDECAVPRLRDLMRIAPWLFAPLASLNTVVVLLWPRHPRASTSFILVEAGQMAAFAIVIAYAYVLVVYVIDSRRAERQSAHGPPAA
ncbi:MAG: hypothetical protein Q8K82_25055 [Gemmatimonadaceae bacterium]|nr:hypothetical protein [Gemmatimonadaceae bacterium]